MSAFIASTRRTTARSIKGLFRALKKTVIWTLLILGALYIVNLTAYYITFHKG